MTVLLCIHDIYIASNEKLLDHSIKKIFERVEVTEWVDFI